jgi:uncharacterized membrane protein YjjP (DUF1212 family)
VISPSLHSSSRERTRDPCVVTQWHIPGIPAARSRVPRQVLDAPHSQLQTFLIDLGTALLNAGTGVTETGDTLRQVAIAQGAPGTRLLVFPNALLVAVPGLQDGPESRVALSTMSFGSLRFDQISAVYELTERAKSAEVTPADGIAELADLRRMPPRFRAWVRILGHGVAAAGVCLLLQSTWQDVLIAALLGMLTGLWVLVSNRLAGGRVLAPIVAAFGVGLIVFTLAKHGIGDTPLYQLVPPIVTFIPGSVLTVAVGELTYGDLVAGSSRLIYGFVLFIQLALGIVAASLAVGLPSGVALHINTGHPPGVSPWVGAVLLGVGFFLLYCGPRGALLWLELVLLVAYSGQVIGGALFGGILSGLVGALLMTPTAYIVQTFPGAPPAAVTFLPSFWLLIPGSVGLIGLTQFVGTNASTAIGMEGFVATIIAISAGVLLGTGAYRLLFAYAPVSWGLRRA